jgi:hypothetical protein
VTQQPKITSTADYVIVEIPLTGPPPCGVCGSTEHGHAQFDQFSVACGKTIAESVGKAFVPVVFKEHK